LKIKNTIIYQKKDYSNSSAFTLSEIVAVMEEYQDRILRMNYKNSLLIKGPAGSGKTTLALHKIAFLSLSPETKDIFTPNNILILLQDEKTQKYFSNVLYDLGLKSIHTMTYTSWLKNILRLEEINYAEKFGQSREQKNFIEYEKYKVLSKIFNKIEIKKYSDPFLLLKSIYENYSDTKMSELFKNQINNSVLDRLDLTILASFALSSDNKVFSTRVWKKEIDKPVYNLIMIDEAENYLKEEINIIKRCLNLATKSILYIGDLKQKTRFFTINSWSEAGESFDENRIISLPKNYRNSFHILKYLSSQNYEVEFENAPDLKGEIIEEKVVSTEEKINLIQQTLLKIKQGTIGIITEDERLKNLENEKIHLLNFSEAQGVEFDHAIVDFESFRKVQSRFDEIYNKERKRVERDTFYVAVTRAKKSLLVIK